MREAEELFYTLLGVLFKNDMHLLLLLLSMEI